MKNEPYCTNYTDCKLVHTELVLDNTNKKNQYLELFCRSYEVNWTRCKRYLVKLELGFCPSFVLPDTDLTIEEIIDKFEELELEN